MTFRIAVDTGGTFSDVVVTNSETRQLWVNKAPTTYDRVFEGISDALTVVGEEIGMRLDDLLSQTSLFTYGTTFSTNAIITGDTARTAFLTTAGHPDTLVLREGGKQPDRRAPAGSGAQGGGHVVAGPARVVRRFRLGAVIRD